MAVNPVSVFCNRRPENHTSTRQYCAGGASSSIVRVMVGMGCLREWSREWCAVRAPGRYGPQPPPIPEGQIVGATAVGVELSAVVAGPGRPGLVSSRGGQG